MLIKQLIEVFDLLDSSTACGADIADYLRGIDPKADVEVSPLVGPRGKTDMVKVRIPGTNGKAAGGTAPTIGILGRLGAIGARPEMIGYVSDGDGALVALTVAAKLLDMRMKGDFLPGDVFISTHICPDAPTQPHKPVPFMGSPVEMAQVNRAEVTPDLDAVLSVDTTKGNRVISHYTDVEEAARFMLEVAKAYGRGEVSFYDEEEFARIQKLYGTMNHIQTLGRED